MITIPLRTGRGQNDREHWATKARRVKREKEAVMWCLPGNFPRPTIPCVVLLTRIAPSNGLDDDNLSGSLKAVRDQVARWLRVDDADPRVRWTYGQRRGKPKEWAVEVSFA